LGPATLRPASSRARGSTTGTACASGNRKGVSAPTAPTTRRPPVMVVWPLARYLQPATRRGWMDAALGDVPSTFNLSLENEKPMNKV
jgi:hypothetical protein